jgi:hypothetical protein
MNFRKLFDWEQFLPKTTSNREKSVKLPQEIPLKIAHEVPGRIRFTIPRLATDSEYADQLKALIEADAQIQDFRINKQAASITVNYEAEALAHDQMRAHLVHLIQIAPQTDEPKKATARTILAAIFDATINFIDSVRNVNNARKGIAHGRLKTDTWERVLSKAKNLTQGLKSTSMFVLPKRSSDVTNIEKIPTDQKKSS